MGTTFLTTRQAAGLLGLKENTLEIWRHRGVGPNYCKLGRAVRYRADDLMAWVDSRVKTPEADLQSCA